MMQTASAQDLVPVRGTTDGANCVECPFARMGDADRPVVGEGPAVPEWIIIGEGPGQNEVLQGRPFVGASGRVVSDALVKINVRRENVWITNATLCQPPSGATDAAKRAARTACARRLQRELLDFPQRPILALGAVAAQGFLGDRLSITKMAGAYYEVDVAEYPWKPIEGAIELPAANDIRAIIPSIHPAAILRGSGDKRGGGAHTVDLQAWSLIYDMAKVARVAQGADIFFTDDIAIEHEDTRKADELVREFMLEARRAGAFACDTETYVSNPKKHSALQPVHARMNAIGLATTSRGISIAWDVLSLRGRRFIASLLADTSIVKIFHNSIYDVPVLGRHDLPVRGQIEDTLLLHHSAFPGLAHDLQRATTQFYCITPWKAEFRAGQGTTEELLRYNARDSLATARIYAPLFISATESKSMDTYQIDLAMARAAEKMHMVGVPISREINSQLRAQFRANIDKAQTELLNQAYDPQIRNLLFERLAFEQARRVRKHDPIDLDARIQKRIDELEAKTFEFKIGSPDHMVAFLRARGVPLSIQTPTGRISTKKDILESYMRFPEVRALITYRENAKLLSTYVERMFDRHYASGKILWGFADDNDRVHPRWSIHKITGRWGSEAPVMQNVPKADKKKGRPNLRSQVVAPPHRKLVGFDFAQLEARIIALLSHDPFLLSIFHNDRDIHSEFARIVWPNFDTRPPDERKVLRDMVKRPEYGAFYGGAVDTLWKAVVRDYPNVTLQMIATMVSTMKTKMPQVGAWHQRMMRVAEQHGEIRSVIYGRRRVFPLRQFDLSEVVNFPVQSTAADLMNRGLMRTMQALPETAFPILQIHDAAIFECDEGDAEDVRDIVRDCFTQEVTYEGVTVAFPIDVKIGNSWAEVN